MKNTLFVLGLLLCFSDAMAQRGIRLGIEAGAQISNRRYGIPQVNPVNSSYYEINLNKGYSQKTVGERAGIVAVTPLAGKFSFQTGLHFNTKGFQEWNVMTRGYLSNGKAVLFYADYSTTLYYVDLPLQIVYRFGKNESGGGLSVSGGPYLSWLAAATERIKPNNQPASSGAPQLPDQRKRLSIGYRPGTYDYNGLIEHRDDYRPLDVGLQAGLSYEFRFKLYIKLQGQFGLTNIVNGHVYYDSNFYPMKPEGFVRIRSAALSAGYYFPFKKR